MAFVEIYRDRDKLRTAWRWRRMASNNRIIANGGESFTRRADAKRAALLNYPDDEVRFM